LERAPELTPAEEAERARRLRRFWALVQAGGIVFLAVTALGLIPTIVSSFSPALGRGAAIAVYVLAPLVPLGLLVVAVLRLRR
jgi:hypothetical protein